MTTFMQASPAETGQRIRQRILQWVGVPVCVGVGCTKTLAKLANHCAKKGLDGEEGVCDLNILPEPQLAALLDRIEVGEIWGIGRRLGIDPSLADDIRSQIAEVSAQAYEFAGAF